MTTSTQVLPTKSLSIRRLSYSSLLTFHHCPRRFYLSRHQDQKEESIHLAYGSAVGVGIQEIIKGSSLETAYFQAFLAWSTDLEESEDKSQKNFWMALQVISKFAAEVWPQFQKAGWEIFYYKDQPANELGFKLHLFDGFHLLGFLDCVLINKRTGEIRVLELKTTKYNAVHEALYGNSSQGTGYAVLLDALAANTELPTSYEVLYFVVKSTSRDFEPLPFKKSFGSKAAWLRDIVNDVNQIATYEQQDYWPKRGEACWNYASYRPCQFYGMCDMSLRGIFLKDLEWFNQQAATKAAEEDAQGTYALTIDLNTVIDQQIEGV